VYDGRNGLGAQLHPNGGYNGRVIPTQTLTASTGELLISFKSGSLRAQRGWRVVYSADCPQLKLGEGAIPSSRDTHFGAEIGFTCPFGQIFATGDEFLNTTCMIGGKWTKSYIPKCQEVYCGPVPQIANGFAIQATNVTYRGEATYQCYAGFGFPSGRSTETISCLEDGEWEDLPLCAASMCPPIERVENANATLLNGGGRNYGTVINFECEPGYVMAGIPTVLCQSNGTWSAGVPQCSRVRCPVLPTILNGIITNITRNYAFGDEARVQCHKGFRINGSSIIRCGPNGDFVNVPVCQDIDECVMEQCDGASTVCENVPGSFHCDCKAGFTPSLECKPVTDLGLGSGALPNELITVSGFEPGFPKEVSSSILLESENDSTQ
ncbi:CUB and sushi domain-containing protein 3-like, partial [Artemia franciscana]|uniref:CUB and sushi domain-containing protein 3-like n=1 Tax=Artemia franciscana TaxID=6661 RepID=UPI0032DAEC5E